MRNPDPLKISYLVVQGDDRLDQVSPFQGFGESWPSTLWALRFLAVAPASLVERRFPLPDLIAQRMGGMNRLDWIPLWIGALEQLNLDQIGFVVVICSGDEAVAARVDAWSTAQPRPVLHLRADLIEDDEAATGFCDTVLRGHCTTLVEDYGEDLSPSRCEAARLGLAGWLMRERIVDTDAPGGHNITLPNQMVLQRADRTLPHQDPFIATSEESYDAHAVASAQSVLDLRDATGFRNFNRLFLPQPGLVLTEPALYRSLYSRMRSDPAISTPPMMAALRRLQRQTGLWSQMAGKDAIEFLEDPQARALVAARQEELATHCHGVGLMAAQTCSAVLRLRPAVNHVFPVLGRYANNIRSTNDAARFKTPRLFDDIQRELKEAVGQARINLIETHDGPIKIVCDAPIELLPVGELPIGLKYDCSRINATPGNLMMGVIAGHQPVTIGLATLRKVLVISGFAEDDRLRNLVERAIAGIAVETKGLVELAFVRVTNRSELVAALNASDATILIFDGHGVAGDADGIGGIEVNGTKIDVWGLREDARIPPIVVLSACDTHGLDAQTHATVGNGFLAAGAMSVLATILPIGGIEGAVFVTRLLLRLSHYLPAALGENKRVYNWCEFIAGLLRMVLGTDLVGGMLKEPAAIAKYHLRANFHINSGNPGWYENILDDLAGATGLEIQAVQRRARGIMARSEAIRYVQLGTPEFILIDDGSISDAFFPPEAREALGLA